MMAYVSVKPIGEASSAEGFFEIFLGVPVFVVVGVGYKLWGRTRMVDPREADLGTGRRPLTVAEKEVLERYEALVWWRRGISYLRF